MMMRSLCVILCVRSICSKVRAPPTWPPSLRIETLLTVDKICWEKETPIATTTATIELRKYINGLCGFVCEKLHKVWQQLFWGAFFFSRGVHKKRSQWSVVDLTIVYSYIVIYVYICILVVLLATWKWWRFVFM